MPDPVDVDEKDDSEADGRIAKAMALKSGEYVSTQGDEGLDLGWWLHIARVARIEHDALLKERNYAQRPHDG